MKLRIQRFLIILTVAAMALMPLCAADDAWWNGMVMTAFRYQGLQNVSERTVNNLLKRYIGVEFSDSTFAEMNSVLYAQPWLSYVTAEALMEGENDDLVIQFTIYENPMISSISVEGSDKIRERTLISNQNITKGSYFTPGVLSVGEGEVKDYYLQRGYRDIQVSSTTELDEETNTMDVVYHVVEGKQYKVRSIIFNGIDGLTIKEIEGVLTQKEKSFFNNGNFLQSDIDTDKNNIISLYGTEGYPDARIDSVEIVPTGEEDDNTIYVNVVYTITEGDRWTIGTIDFEGNSIYSDSEISALITIREGDPYNVADISVQYETIASLYYDNGYIRSMIDFVPTRDEVNHIINYHIVILEGDQSVVEDIVITGLSKTKPYVMERELMMNVGDVFSRSRLIRSQQNLMNTGLINTVKADLLYGDTENGVIVELEVEEGNQMELQFGATFGGTVDEFPISGFLQWTNRNLAGTGRNLSLGTTLSPDTQSVSVSISDDWVGDKRWANGISLTFEHSYRDDTLQRDPTSDYYDGRDDEMVTFPLGYPSAESWYAKDNPLYPSDAYLMAYHYWRIAVGYDTGYTFVFEPGSLTLSAGVSFGINRAYYDDTQYDPYELLIKRYHENWQWSNRLTLSITWDGRDLVQNTTKGYVFSASWTYAGGFLGGLSNYNRFTVSGAGFLSLFSYMTEEGDTKNLVLSLTSSVSFMFDQFWNSGDGNGWSWHIAKEGATRYEMLYIDGMNIGRGFDVVYDKAFLWHNQLELSFPIVNRIVAVEAFVSATGATSSLNALDSFSNIDWYFAGGIGLKMQIPGFPLGLYLVKNATWTHGNGFEWESGLLFANSNREGSGLKIVLAITTSLY